MRQWAEAAIARRHLSVAIRTLVACGFVVHDVLVDGDSAQHADRLLVGPTGLYVVGFRSARANAWQPGHPADVLEPHARATRRLAAVVRSALHTDLARRQVAPMPLLTVIGPDPAPGSSVAGVPLLGPRTLTASLLDGQQVLTMRQVDELAAEVEEWLQRRSVTSLHLRSSAGARPAGRGAL